MVNYLIILRIVFIKNNYLLVYEMIVWIFFIDWFFLYIIFLCIVGYNFLLYKSGI